MRLLLLLLLPPRSGRGALAWVCVFPSYTITQSTNDIDRLHPIHLNPPHSHSGSGSSNHGDGE